MKNTLTTIGISIVMLGGLIWLAWPRAAPSEQMAATDGMLVASVSFHNFGTTSMANGKVTYEYRLVNEGTEEVTVGKVYTSCMCTSAVLSVGDRNFGPYGMSGHGFIPRVNETIVPGGSAQLAVTFDPAAHGPAGVGQVKRSVTVEQDGTGPLIVSFEAEVTP
jgi:hypothetical protein